MTARVRSPTMIHFSIDGRPSVLEAKQIVKALRIPFEPKDPCSFRQWFPVSQRDMVHILSKGTSTDSVLLWKVFPLGMLLIDVGFYFGLHHLIMAFLIHFEEKVHRKKLQRADTIPLLFPRLLCQILEYLGFPTEPRLERRRLCRERFTLEKWTLLTGYFAPPRAPPMVAPLVPLRPEQGELSVETTASVPTLEATSGAPPTTPTVPLVALTTSEPSITISASEFCALVHTFQTLTTTHSALFQQMVEMRAHQDQ
ncbi:hypothetical protein AAG906_037549 [Vitis piasezkii]